MYLHTSSHAGVKKRVTLTLLGASGIATIHWCVPDRRSNKVGVRDLNDNRSEIRSGAVLGSCSVEEAQA